MNRTVSVDNLSGTCTEDDLRTVFAPFGPVQILLATDNAGRHLGFAFVVCNSAAAADQAIASLNGMNLKGKCIRVRRVIPRFRDTNLA
jgi:cold-inducible RNA-binding protein